MVKPEYRGKGYGIQLWNKAIEYLGDRNIGLDGVVAQQDNYRKSGFVLDFRNIRYEGMGESYTLNLQKVIPLNKIPFEEVLEYDSHIFSLPRPRFLKTWLEQPHSYCLAVVREKKLAGYGMIRPCRKGYKIGPLLADDKDIADELFKSLIGNIPGEPFYFDTPQSNPQAVAMAERYRMKKVFETARMYNKKTGFLPVNKIFGVTTFELG